MRVHIENIKDLNPTADYKLVDTDFGMFADSYYGYKNSKGHWYIGVAAGSSFRWVKGDSDYATNWTNREILVYGTYGEVF